MGGSNPVPCNFVNMEKPCWMKKEKNDNAHFHEWLLGCSKEHKIMLMKKAIEDRNVAAYFQLTTILLDTPISMGGISSDEIPHPVEILNHDKKEH